MEEPGEPILQCPYDRAHTILASRMQFHLTRCRVQYPNEETAVCPFNSTHVVNRVEMKLHTEVCPDRGVVDSFITRVGDFQPAPGLQAVKNFDITPFSDECWDDEVLEESVVDRVKSSAVEKNVLIQKSGASKAERKNHRMNERLRFQATASQMQPNHRENQDSRQNEAIPRSQPPQNAAVPRSQPPQNAAVPRSQPTGSGVQSSSAFGAGISDLDEGLGFLSINSENEKSAELSNASKPNAWGKPIARNQDEKIAAPTFGASMGGPRQVSGRPMSNPWNRNPPAAGAAAAAVERPAPEIRDGPALPPPQGLGAGVPPPRGAWGRSLFSAGPAGINQDDFPTLMPTTNRGRRTRP